MKNLHIGSIRDAAETTRFYRDVMGLELVGFVIDDKVPSTGDTAPLLDIIRARRARHKLPASPQGRNPSSRDTTSAATRNDRASAPPVSTSKLLAGPWLASAATSVPTAEFAEMSCNVQICFLRLAPSATVSTVRIQSRYPNARFTRPAILSRFVMRYVLLRQYLDLQPAQAALRHRAVWGVSQKLLTAAAALFRKRRLKPRLSQNLLTFSGLVRRRGFSVSGKNAPVP